MASTTHTIRRREFIGLTAGGTVALGLGGGFWKEILGGQTEPRRPGKGYGPLGRPDQHGIRLPEGFRARLVARGEQPVPGTSYSWHLASDGSATFPIRDGGWILVSNAETVDGGASAIRFSGDGRIADAYRILGGTSHNCAGGATPWGTWLSCEEVEDGRVWECDPAGSREARVLPALGVFKHEAAAVDPKGRRIYLTEDLMDGGLYRFTPARWPSLSAGLLEIATVAAGGSVSWSRVPDPAARRQDTRRQVAGSTRFKRAEGIWHDRGRVYVATTGDSRVHAYDIARERIELIYDGLASRSAPLLRVDQLTASRAGEIFVCEDLATDEIHIGVIERSGAVSHFLAVGGPEHQGSELTGAAFDPSGRRLYFSSQRAFKDAGAVYEVRGPFRGAA